MTGKFALAALVLVSLVPCVSALAQGADEEKSAPPVRFTSAVTAGGLSFPDGRTQQGASAVVRWHPAQGLALGITPSLTRVSFPTALGGGAATGMSDIPLELTYDREIDVAMSPTVGASFVATLPVGDTASGFGSGSLGSSLSLGVGLSPVDRVSFHVGAGRPLSDFATDGALGGSRSTWADAEASYELQKGIEAQLGFDGDFSADSGKAPARAMIAGVSFAVRGPLTLTVNGGHGFSGEAARWSLSIGLGTDFASLASLGSSSTVRRAVGALGGRSSHSGRGSGIGGRGPGSGNRTG
jgi:hypothetical protein